MLEVDDFLLNFFDNTWNLVYEPVSAIQRSHIVPILLRVETWEIESALPFGAHWWLGLLKSDRLSYSQLKRQHLSFSQIGKLPVFFFCFVLKNSFKPFSTYIEQATVQSAHWVPVRHARSLRPLSLSLSTYFGTFSFYYYFLAGLAAAGSRRGKMERAFFMG